MQWTPSQTQTQIHRFNTSHSVILPEHPKMATSLIPSNTTVSILSYSRKHNPQSHNLLSFKSNSKISSCKLVCNRQRSILETIFTKLPRTVVANSDFNEAEPASESNEGTRIDLQLPRRSMLVRFTCNACGVRTERLMNRLAYERGTVFVQCAGCLKHHKLVDNLGMVVEYNLLEETTTDLNESV